MNNLRIIGLMSGTSLDGLDLIDVSIWEAENSLKFQIHNTLMLPYPKEQQAALNNCFTASKKELETYSSVYGEFLGKAVLQFINENSIPKIDFVASHGHTVFHRPEEGITVQIGNGQVLSSTSGLKVICDFRTQDVALGGQGAPLVPIGDKLFFSDYDYCLNLGGFANISFDEEGIRKAYDVCPVNIVLNHYTRKLGLEYDENGHLARSGRLNKSLLEVLNNLPFYTAPYPKSLGYEFVAENVLPLIDAHETDIATILRTFTEHVAVQLSKNLKKDSATALITGGGAYNSYLIERLKALVTLEITLPSKELIDFKEALIFALLGYLKSLQRINCLSSVTGAGRDHSSGKIYEPKNSI